MRDSLQQLIYRQHAAIADEQLDSDRLNAERENLTSLVLADAALAKAEAEFPEHPIQIVVVGPTQVGKSSVANMLIGQGLADASPVAGYTVHCQGFFLTDLQESSVDTAWLKSIFDGHLQRSQCLLDRDLLSEYSFSIVRSESGQLQNMVVWDTPDFDSVDSLHYSVPVLRAIALADLVVFVVSKEKYADKSVWNLLRFLRDLNVPLIPVMNKAPVAIREELSESYRSKYTRIANTGEIPELQFIDDYKDHMDRAYNSDDIKKLQIDILSMAGRRQSEVLAASARRFVKLHWNAWTAPVIAEHQLRIQWKNDVDLVCNEAIHLYQSQYLQHDRYKETFQLALAELLTLLEVPGIAKPITQLRSLVTWPVRKLKQAAESHQSGTTGTQDDRSEERRLLEGLADHAMTQLATRCAERHSDAGFWEPLASKLTEREPELIDGYHRGLDSYQIMLKSEVERAAQSLYRKLQEQPATLGRLRAARVTADAAAIVLAVKSGGLGAVDLILAPAMLSLTTMLTEGALGRYMDSVQNDLREYQLRETTVLINKKLRQRLKSIAKDLDDSDELYINERQLKRTAESLGI